MCLHTNESVPRVHITYQLSVVILWYETCLLIWNQYIVYSDAVILLWEVMRLKSSFIYEFNATILFFWLLLYKFLFSVYFPTKGKVIQRRWADLLVCNLHKRSFLKWFISSICLLIYLISKPQILIFCREKLDPRLSRKIAVWKGVEVELTKLYSQQAPVNRFITHPPTPIVLSHIDSTEQFESLNKSQIIFGKPQKVLLGFESHHVMSLSE